MEQAQDTNNTADAQSSAGEAEANLTDVLDATALNDAGWEFIAAWRTHTDQEMSENTFNNIKPMIAAAIRKYLKASNVKVRGGAQLRRPS